MSKELFPNEVLDTVNKAAETERLTVLGDSLMDQAKADDAARTERLAGIESSRNSFANPEIMPTNGEVADLTESARVIGASQAALGKREKTQQSMPRSKEDAQTDTYLQYGTGFKKLNYKSEIIKNVASNPDAYVKSLDSSIAKQVSAYLAETAYKSEGGKEVRRTDYAEHLQVAIDVAYEDGQNAVATKLQNKLDTYNRRKAREAKQVERAREAVVKAQLDAEEAAQKVDGAKLDDHSKNVLELLNGQTAIKPSSSKNTHVKKSRSETVKSDSVAVQTPLNAPRTFGEPQSSETHKRTYNSKEAISKKEIRLTVGSIEQAAHHPNEDTILRNDEAEIYGIFDGAGGHADGDIASRIAAQIVGDKLSTMDGDKYATPDEALKDIQDAFNEARLAIGLQTENGITTGAIVKMLAINGEKYVLAGGAGDSRIILQKDGQLTDLIPEQSDGNVIHNWLGKRSGSESDQFNAIKLEPGMKILICSGGITGDWDFQRLSDDEFDTAFNQSTPQEAAEKFLALSKKDDDKTAIVLFAGELVAQADIGTLTYDASKMFGPDKLTTQQVSANMRETISKEDGEAAMDVIDAWVKSALPGSKRSLGAMMNEIQQNTKLNEDDIKLLMSLYLINGYVSADKEGSTKEDPLVYTVTQKYQAEERLKAARNAGSQPQVRSARTVNPRTANPPVSSRPDDVPVPSNYSNMDHYDSLETGKHKLEYLLGQDRVRTERKLEDAREELKGLRNKLSIKRWNQLFDAKINYDITHGNNSLGRSSKNNKWYEKTYEELTTNAEAIEGGTYNVSPKTERSKQKAAPQTREQYMAGLFRNSKYQYVKIGKPKSGRIGNDEYFDRIDKKTDEWEARKNATRTERIRKLGSTVTKKTVQGTQAIRNIGKKQSEENSATADTTKRVRTGLARTALGKIRNLGKVDPASSDDPRDDVADKANRLISSSR